MIVLNTTTLVSYPFILLAVWPMVSYKVKVYQQLLVDVFECKFQVIQN